MTDHHTARYDSTLSARVRNRRPMHYEEGASQDEDRPAHVRAASGLSYFKEYLVVVQDDANWLALIDTENRVHALPFPASSDGCRVFSASRGNKHDKFDLEACTTVPGENGHELIGFGSGSHRGREWMLRLHEGRSVNAVMHQEVAHAATGIAVTAEFLDARPFYDSVRQETAFSGAGLNIEGAVTIDDDRIMLFQRGNAPAKPGGEPPVNATAVVSWNDLAAHLSAPDHVPPPRLVDVRRYDLGTLDGVRLTFSDADVLPGGRLLYSASAEDSETGRCAGSAIGVIAADGEARWAEILDQDGSRFRDKIEGLSYVSDGSPRIRFVIDADDETVPSEIFDAELGAGFLAA